MRADGGFEVGALDVPTLLVATAILLITAIVATWLPALRATRVNPVSALRAE